MFQFGYLGEDPVNSTDPIGRGAWLDAVGVGLSVIGLGIAVGGALVTAPSGRRRHQRSPSYWEQLVVLIGVLLAAEVAS